MKQVFPILCNHVKPDGTTVTTLLPIPSKFSNELKGWATDKFGLELLKVLMLRVDPVVRHGFDLEISDGTRDNSFPT